MYRNPEDLQQLALILTSCRGDGVELDTYGILAPVLRVKVFP
jgi:hypothetical protein